MPDGPPSPCWPKVCSNRGNNPWGWFGGQRSRKNELAPHFSSLTGNKKRYDGSFFSLIWKHSKKKLEDVGFALQAFGREAFESVDARRAEAANLWHGHEEALAANSPNDS